MKQTHKETHAHTIRWALCILHKLKVSVWQQRKQQVRVLCSVEYLSEVCDGWSLRVVLTYAIKEREVGRRDKMKAEEEGNVMWERRERPTCLIIVCRMKRKMKAKVTDLLVCNDGSSVRVLKRKTSLTYLNRLVAHRPRFPTNSPLFWQNARTTTRTWLYQCFSSLICCNKSQTLTMPLFASITSSIQPETSQ